MAYEKYIKKDGKIYGPYIYQSKRIDGKVVSEYHGQKKFGSGKLAFIIPLALLIIFGAYLIGHGQNKITGHAVLNLNANYQEGQTLNGQLKISMNQGELIPAGSNLVFQNGGQTYSYPLQTLISEPTSQGTFFFNGQNLGGSGDGFGIAGTKTIYPNVQFTLIISSANSSQVSGTTTGANTSTAPPSENSTNTENSTTLNQNMTTTTTQQTPAQSGNETNNSGPGLLGVIGNFFLGLNPTGHAIVEFQNEIQGNVSGQNVFTQILQPGETAEIKPTSIHTDSGRQLPDSTAILATNGNVVSVTTSYSEQQQGFGPDFSGNATKDIPIDLGKLNLQLQKGLLSIDIIYKGQNILSVSSNVIPGNVSGTSPANSITPQTQGNNSGNGNNTSLNVTFNNNVTASLINQTLILTPEERAILVNKFGNISVQTTQAKKQNGFITVRYEIGTYWVEHSYSADLGNATLSSFMNADMIKFLKDIAASLSENFSSGTTISGLLGNSSF